MKGYTQIHSKEDFDLALSSIAGLHDSLAKQVVVMNRGYVDSSGAMWGPPSFDVQILFQSQWPPHAVELVFIGVDELVLAGAGEYWGATVTDVRCSATGDSTLELDVEGGLCIKANQVFFRIREDALGDRAFLNGEVSSPYAVPAAHFRDDWRQCSACSDIWQASDNSEYERCPSCSRLTCFRRDQS